MGYKLKFFVAHRGKGQPESFNYWKTNGLVIIVQIQKIKFIIKHKRGCSSLARRNFGSGRSFASGPVRFDSAQHKEHAGLHLEPIGLLDQKLFTNWFLIILPRVPSCGIGQKWGGTFVLYIIRFASSQGFLNTLQNPNWTTRSRDMGFWKVISF